MGWVEHIHVWAPTAVDWTKEIHNWGWFIDDVIIIWTSTENQMKAYFNFLNNNPFNVTLTLNMSWTRIQFLDVEFYVVGNKLQNTLFRKKTSVNSILHYNSADPPSTKHGIPFREIIRMRRNCSEYDHFKKHIGQAVSRLRNRGNKEPELLRAANKSRRVKRSDTLKIKERMRRKGCHSSPHTLDWIMMCLKSFTNIGHSWKGSLE